MPDAQQLLKRYCQSDDRSAFNTFYRQQADRLWRFLVARGCDESHAYDLLSESFLKFIQVICKDYRSPLALLYKIAINLQIDDYRRKKISPVDIDNSAVDNYSEFLEESSDMKDYVRRLIKTLPEREQNMLLLRYWIGLTHKEIAVNMNIPEGTVRRQCADVIKALKQRWLDNADG